MTGAAQAKPALASLRDVSVRLGERQVLSHIDLQIRHGEIVTLIGPNGSGKTTLVRVVLGLLLPDSGEVVRAAGLTLGYMPQRISIDPVLPLSVRRFVGLGCKATRTAIRDALAETGCEDLADHALHVISGGEMQRVLLARALLRDPDLLVLDEPAQGVDVTGQHELYELIDQVRRRHDCGVLMVSHDLHLVMAATDNVVCLNNHICCSGHPSAVTQDQAYLELFGDRVAQGLAVYTHSHDHRHDMHGEVTHGHAGEHDGDG